MQHPRGVVYLIFGGGYHKIGRAKDINNRMAGFSGGLPFETVLLACSQEMDMPGRYERRLHKKFTDKRGRGEWFTLNEEEVTEAITYINNL